MTDWPLLSYLMRLLRLNSALWTLAYYNLLIRLKDTRAAPS